MILIEALEKIQDSLTKQGGQGGKIKQTKSYTKLGNGIYEDGDTGTLYIRDLRVVCKTVIVKGEQSHKGGKEINAIIDAIKKICPLEIIGCLI